MRVVGPVRGHPLAIDLVDWATRDLPPLPALAVAVHLSECGYCRLNVMRVLEHFDRET